MNVQGFSRASRNFIKLISLVASFSACGTASAQQWTSDTVTSTLTALPVNYRYIEFTPEQAGEAHHDGTGNVDELQWAGRSASGGATLLLIFPGGGQIGSEFCHGYYDVEPPRPADGSQQDACRQAIAAGYQVLAINHPGHREQGPGDECEVDEKFPDSDPRGAFARCLYATRYYTLFGKPPPSNTPLGDEGAYTASDVASSYRVINNIPGNNYGLPLVKNNMSLTNTRLMKSIEYLEQTDNPQPNTSRWKKFCNKHNNQYDCAYGIDWSKVHVIGGSQGTNYAAFMSKFISLPHVGLMSGPCDKINDDEDPIFPPSWMSYYPNGSTPRELIFSVRHVDDELCAGQAETNLGLDGLNLNAFTNQFLVPDNKQTDPNDPDEQFDTCWTTGITNLISAHAAPAFCGHNYNGPGISNRIPNQSGNGWSNGVWTNRIFGYQP